MGGTSIEEVRGACFAGSSPPFLGRSGRQSGAGGRQRERTLVCFKAPRWDTNEGCEIEVTVTSEQHAQEYNSKLNPIAVIRVAEATHDVLM